MNKLVFSLIILLSGFCVAGDNFVITKQYKADAKTVKEDFVITEKFSTCICKGNEGVSAPCNPLCACGSDCKCTNCTCGSHTKSTDLLNPLDLVVAEETPQIALEPEFATVTQAMQPVKTLKYRTETRKVCSRSGGGCSFKTVQVPYYEWTYPKQTQVQVKKQVAPAPVKRAYVPSKGMHSHVCGRCGTEFWHYSGSHRCPKCGSGPWTRINRRS